MKFPRKWGGPRCRGPAQGAKRPVEFKRGIQNTQNLQCREQVQRTETCEHKPRDIEAGPGSQNKCNKSHGIEGRPSEPKLVHTCPATQKASSGGWGKPTQASMMQRAGPGSWEKIHTGPYLATFSLQCRVGPGDRSTGKDSRDKQGAGGSEDMLIRSLWCDCRNRCVSHCQIQKDCPKTYWNHRHPHSYYWTLHCPSERWDPVPSTRIQEQALPTRKISQDTNPTPSMGADSTTKKNYDFEDFFFL